MKTQELRIGSILNYYIGSSVKQDVVTGLSTNKIVLGHNTSFNLTSLFDQRRLIPTPLTEEWLRRLHSEDEIEKSVRLPNEITIYDRFLFIWKPEYKYWYVVTAYHKEYLTKIEFVHEYQNFIYTLMGKELTPSDLIDQARDEKR